MACAVRRASIVFGAFASGSTRPTGRRSGRKCPSRDAGAEAAGRGPTAPLPGTVVTVSVTAGERVSSGQVLVVLEAMNNEHRIVAHVVVEEVLIAGGDRVDAGQVLVVLAALQRRSCAFANCSGFYGDRLSAAREMVDGGPIDAALRRLAGRVTPGQGSPPASGGGWARTFLTQMEQVLGTCAERGIKVVSNAGGLDPAACAQAVRELASTLGISVTVAHVEGDDLLPRSWPELQADGESLTNLDTGERFADLGVDALTANAYLGRGGDRRLSRGADVVATAGDRRRAGRRPGRLAFRLGAHRLGRSRRRGGWARHRVRHPGDGGNYSFFTRCPGSRWSFPIGRGRGRLVGPSPSTRAPAGWCRLERSPPSCSTRSPVRPTSIPTSWPASTRSRSVRRRS